MLKPSYSRFILAFAASVVFLAAAVFAGTNGKITGVIKDKETGDALPGVNVILEGTTMGAATNAKGEFSIINVPAGVYTVSTSMIGYTKTTKQNVRVLPDFTTRLDFDLSPEVLGGEEVVITAERPLIQKDQTMTMTVTSSEEIKNLPVRGFQGVANLGTGFVVDATIRNTDGGLGNTNVRGGRPSETGVYLDGFLQNNLLTGVSNVQVANSAVEEIVAITGGFNAEYGRNQSGIIQIITKSGGTRYSGNLEYVTDKVAPGFGAGDFGYNNYSGGFGGPLIPGNQKIKFYVSGELQRWADGEPSYFGFPNFSLDTTSGDVKIDPTTNTYLVGSVRRYRHQGFTDWGIDTVLLDLDGDGNPTYDDRGARPDRANAFDYYTAQGKLTYNVTNSLRFELHGNLGETKRKVFANNRTLDLNHVQRNQNTYWQFGALGTWTIDENSFFELGGNYNYNRRRIMDDEFGWNVNWYADSIGVTKVNYKNLGLHYAPGAGNELFQQQFDTYWAFKANYVNQIDKHNLFKLGADFYRHTVRLLEINQLTGDPAYGTNNFVGIRVIKDGNRFKIVDVDDDDFDAVQPADSTNPFPLDGAKHPISFALFGQDKLEYEGLVLNLGLRYDLFNPGSKRIRSFFNPLGDPDDSTDNLEIGSEDYTSGKTDHKLSPRISVSFPVSEKTTFRLSYGKFFQQPNLQTLYVGSNFFNEMVTIGPFAADVQNPNLEAEESTQYEVGLQRAVTDNMKFDVSAYYKDINNLVNTQRYEVNPDAGYKSIILYGNNDRGIVKGLVLAMELRRTKKVSGRMAYTLQYANGTGSDENSGFQAAWLGYEETKFNAPLNFDQRHRLNMSLDIRNGKKEGPDFAGYILQNAGVNFLVSAGSGFPYTPISPSSIGFGVPSGRVTARRNSQYGPWTFRIDLKADKTFDITGQISMTAYLQIFNLLNTRNAVNVHAATGDPLDDGYLTGAQGQLELSQKGPTYAQFYDMRMRNGLFFDTPRQARLGVVLNF